MVDLSNMNLVSALAETGCPLCRELERSERWEIEIFVRDGRFSREARPAFVAGGGYCHRHAWLLHDRAVEKGTGAPIFDLYGMMIKHDLRVLNEFRETLSAPPRRHRPWRRRQHVLSRVPCLACREVQATDERHAYFFMQALREEPVRQRYVRSDGLCVRHAAAVLDAALDEDELGVPRFLVDDLLARLERTYDRLADYDRKRDYRFANEPKGDEQQSWTDVIRLYTGEKTYGQTKHR